jgi:hypothetical protein
MRLIRTEEGAEVITLADAKEYLQVDFDTDDDLIERLITAARKYVEQYCGITIVNSTYELNWHHYDYPAILPYGQVLTIESIKVDTETVDADTSVKNGVVYKVGNLLEVEYTAGFDVVPDDLINAIYEVLKLMYDGRGTAIELSYPLKATLQLYSRNLFI